MACPGFQAPQACWACQASCADHTGPPASCRCSPCRPHRDITATRESKAPESACMRHLPTSARHTIPRLAAIPRIERRSQLHTGNAPCRSGPFHKNPVAASSWADRPDRGLGQTDRPARIPAQAVSTVRRSGLPHPGSTPIPLMKGSVSRASRRHAARRAFAAAWMKASKPSWRQVSPGRFSVLRDSRFPVPANNDARTRRASQKT